jgi:hypothetical protein
MPSDHHACDAARIRDVFQRIALQENEIGDIADRGEAASVPSSKKIRPS